MKRSNAIMAIEIVILVIGVAVFVPQVIARSNSANCSEVVANRGEEVLRYARERLWNDFINARSEMFAGHSLPAPSLEEYMYFLNGNGLYRKGDQVVIPVLPPMDEPRGVERVKVELKHTTLPVQLKVSLLTDDRTYVLVGEIEVFVESDGEMSISSTPAAPAPGLLSYWPVKPGALLP